MGALFLAKTQSNATLSHNYKASLEVLIVWFPVLGTLRDILGTCYITALKTLKQTFQLVSVRFEGVNRIFHKGGAQIGRWTPQPTLMTALVRAEPNRSLEICPPIKRLRGDQSKEGHWPGPHLEQGVEVWNFVNFTLFIFIIFLGQYLKRRKHIPDLLLTFEFIWSATRHLGPSAQ